MPKFEVKKVKSFTGRDGQGYNVDLWMDGAKIAYVLNEGNGGETNFEFVSKEAEKKFEDFIAAHPPYEVDDDLKNLYPNGMATMTRCIFVGMLLDNRETSQKIGRACKAKTIFKLPNDKLGEYRFYKIKFDQRAKEIVLKKHPTAIIINELYPDGEWFSVLFGERTHGNTGKA